MTIMNPPLVDQRNLTEQITSNGKSIPQINHQPVRSKQRKRPVPIYLLLLGRREQGTGISHRSHAIIRALL